MGGHPARPFPIFPIQKDKISDLLFPLLWGEQKIPHLQAGDLNYLPTKLVARLTELTSSRGDQERGVREDIANSKVC